VKPPLKAVKCWALYGDLEKIKNGSLEKSGRLFLTFWYRAPKGVSAQNKD
jgi:hypothetical protein